MKLQFRMLSLAVLAALPALAHAQASDDTAALDQVLVTATRTPIALQDSIAPAQVIDRAQIESSQATSLQELLAGRAGINLTNSGGLGKQSSLFLRGTNSSHTVVLVDGVRINSADLGLAMYQDLPLAQIERVEIVRGPQSSLYGADALGGVIQLFTRRNHGEFPPHFPLGRASNGLPRASGRLRGLRRSEGPIRHLAHRGRARQGEDRSLRPGRLEHLRQGGVAEIADRPRRQPADRPQEPRPEEALAARDRPDAAGQPQARRGEVLG